MKLCKTFTILVIILISSIFAAQAQVNEGCDSPLKVTGKQQDRAEFMQNYLLKPSSFNTSVPTHHTTIKQAVKKDGSVKAKVLKSAKSARTIDSTKEVVTARVNEPKKVTSMEVYNEAEYAALQAKVNLEKKAKAFAASQQEKCETNEAKDNWSNRYVTKQAVTKKEDENIGTSMMSWVKDKYSDMLEILPNQISNVMLYRFIEEWYGVHYRMGGTTKKGVDCSAFVQTLYKYVFGMNLLRTACLQFDSSTKIIKNMEDLKEGDLVFFRVNTSRISHVGVYLRNNFFVHSASSKGVSIAKLSSGYWSKYFAGGGRVIE